MTNQHIYITNDEEIKDGWSYDRMMRTVNKIDNVYSSKIILTTDPDLIKNGVQAIDDTFLEWFVKNPSCDYVEVQCSGRNCIEEYGCTKEVCNGVKPLKIIIPKEKPKHPKVLSENGNELFFDEQGNLIKQETLEEIRKYAELSYYNGDEVNAFIDGVKYQSKRMYSEEDIENIWNEFVKELPPINNGSSSDFLDYIKKFKKK
jgi:hypothetical protein